MKRGAKGEKFEFYRDEASLVRRDDRGGRKGERKPRRRTWSKKKIRAKKRVAIGREENNLPRRGGRKRGGNIPCTCPRGSDLSY